MFLHPRHSCGGRCACAPWIRQDLLGLRWTLWRQSGPPLAPVSLLEDQRPRELGRKDRYGVRGQPRQIARHAQRHAAEHGGLDDQLARLPPALQLVNATVGWEGLECAFCCWSRRPQRSTAHGCAAALPVH